MIGTSQMLFVYNKNGLIKQLQLKYNVNKHTNWCYIKFKETIEVYVKLLTHG